MCVPARNFQLALWRCHAIKKRVSSSQGAALCRRPGDGTSLCAASAQLLQLLRRHGHGALATAGHSSSRRNRSLFLLVGKSQTTLRSAFLRFDALGSWAMQFPQRMPLALAPSYRSAKHPWPSPRAESPQIMLENSTCFIPPVIAAIARARARWPQLGSNIRYCSVNFGCRLAHVTTLSALMCCTCPLLPLRVRRVLDA